MFHRAAPACRSDAGGLLILVRWSATRRALRGTEVDEDFSAHSDEILLFSFRTDRMAVGEHAGAFSVKLVTSGAERYRIGRRVVTISPGQVLILNAGQAYASAIDRAGTHSLSFFVPAASLGDLAAPLTRNDAEQLDAPDGAGAAPEALQVAFRPRPVLAGALTQLIAAVRAPSPPPMDHLEERVMRAAALALADSLALAPPDALDHCVRRATREELTGRVLRARDLIHDTAGRVTLPRMADEAGLSPYHFLRVFKAVLGQTPARYARQVRLERAVLRLARGARTDVAARAAGFSSSSALRRALRRVPPLPS